MVELWALALVFLMSITAALGGFFLKLGSKSFGVRLPDRKLILGAFFYVVSTVLFIIALRGGPVSVIFPLTSLSYVWICLLSQRFLNEKMNKIKWTGIAVIIFGVTLVGLG